MTAVTVSIPYHGCAAGIRRAVDAVLGQTHTDLICVVTNDGDRVNSPWQRLKDIDDPRLIRYEASANRGRYFADAVVLAATDTPWFTVHDADDAASPRWLEHCIKAADKARADALLTAQYVVGLRGQRIIEHPKMTNVGREMHHFGHMAGLWRTEWLKTVAGPHPHFRVGYDSLMSTIAWWYGRYAVLDAPIYTRYRRRGSLTTSPKTGGKSEYRLAARAELNSLWHDLRDLPDAAAVGRALRSWHPEVWKIVARDAAVLRQKMEGS